MNPQNIRFGRIAQSYRYGIVGDLLHEPAPKINLCTARLALGQSAAPIRLVMSHLISVLSGFGVSTVEMSVDERSAAIPVSGGAAIGIQG